MLYISKSSNGNYYFHQKYQYDEVYKGKNYNWYGYIQNKNSKKKKRVSVETLYNIKINKFN
jgi:hypothetical protein